MAEFDRFSLGSLSSIRDHQIVSRRSNGIDFIVARSGEKIFAAVNSCPHQHTTSLHQGILRGRMLMCPLHGWTFDLSTGIPEIGNGRLQMLDVTIENDQIFVNIPRPEWDL